MKINLKSILLILLLVIIIFPTLLPLFNPGFFTVHDNTQAERVFQMSKSLSDGQFPVRWVDDLGYGYGYPIFNFYAPLPYYIGGFSNLILNDLLLSTKIVFMVGIVISFFSMYLLASTLTSRWGGIVAGIIYLYFPYHAANIYVRGAVGEYFAYAFLPLVFWSIYVLYKRTNKSKVKIPIYQAILLSIPMSLVVISHNLSAYMLGLFLVPYALFMLTLSKNKKIYIYSLGVFFAFSFLLSSFYVIPAVLESKFTDVVSQVGRGADYPDHFVCIGQLWESAWGFGGSTSGCIDGLSFKLGKLNIILVLFALIFFIQSFIKSKKITHEIIFWVFLLFSIFLMLDYSKFIWDSLPYMEFLQYPWRFLNFSGLFISLIAAFFILKLEKKSIVSILLVFTIVVGTIYFNAKLFSPIDNVNFSNAYYKNIEHIRWDTSKISDEYMPPDFIKPVSRRQLPQEILEIEGGSAVVLLTNSRTNYLEFTKDGEAIYVHINKAHFPSWEARVNGKKIELKKVSRGMKIYLPEGKQEVVMQFLTTPIQRVGNLFTLIGITVVFAVIIAKRKNLL